ncbi:RICIN domain-containing protein [Knoellia sp. CPCC 206453]|uniref:RICIN domain-containing protein n=1 Tax=Knoellia pratensis TaxID=3404796 RepID=UPI003615E56A
MSRAASILSRPLLPLLVFATAWVGLPLPPAQAAAISSVVFNNISGSPALNTDPTSSDESDDVSVGSGGDLYLPSSATASSLGGWVVLDDGTRTPFDSADYDLTPGSTNGEWMLTFTGPNAGTPIPVHQSATVPSMYITTGSGLAAIEADKEFEDTGASMALVDAGTAAAYNGALSEMKGRGNSTWAYPKKPYQIKLASSTELVPGAGTHKTWILLANYLDQSLIRNKLAFDLDGSVLARAGATDHSIKGRMIDLFIDGGFRGSYYLTEKVQVGPTRIAIPDLQKANEAANPSGVSATPVTTTSLTGAPGIREARYVPFAQTPAGFETSGYLLEMDFASGARGERSYVITRYGTPFALKGPEDANAQEVAFIGNRLQQLEDAIYSPSGRNSSGVHFSQLMDVAAWARYYLVQEMTANDDAFKSSTYLYLDNGGLLRPGPVWDADRTLGALRTAPDVGRAHVGDPARLKPRWIPQLLAQPTFREAAQAQYKAVVGPAAGALVGPSGLVMRDAAEVARSAALNKLRWQPSLQSVTFSTPSRDISRLRSYVTRRHAWMTGVFQGTYASGTLPADGVYTIGNGGVALDIRSASLAPGATLQLWTPNGTAAQRFRLQRRADSYYTITNVNSGLALDVKGGAAADGTSVWQYAPNGSNAQKWRVSTLDGRTYTIASALGTPVVADTGGPEDGYVLDAAVAGTQGSPMQIWRSTLGADQQFSLTLVSPSP